MARAQANKEYNTFVQGLITEANPLTFPENASVDEDNFVLERNGKRSRRKGMDYEINYILVDSGVTATTSEPLTLSANEWRGINDVATVGLIVVQQGLDLYFYDLFASSISATQKNLNADSTTPNPTGALTLPAGDPSATISVSPVLGRLVVVNGSKYVYTLRYDTESDLVILEKRIISIRDMFGVDDNLEVDTRPSTNSQAHSYNLQNQGWTTSKVSSFKSGQGKYPSNADIWTLGKDADDNFDSELLVKTHFGTTPAPKGHKIIEAFNRGVSRVVVADSSVTETQALPVTGDDIIGGDGGIIEYRGPQNISIR